ncbi:MAG: 16S rRNA (cytidine(1402)-2'-O)-methyltransferase, partial [Clostridia bacterium]|nr:16S rRNA (cytidine(1402)-2'-O)-methyltransferase [Clostridia bacterium]
YTEQAPRGEYVLVVEGCRDGGIAEAFWQSMDIPTHVKHYMDAGMGKMDAIKQAARDRGVAKNEIYKEMI